MIFNGNNGLIILVAIAIVLTGILVAIAVTYDNMNNGQSSTPIVTPIPSVVPVNVTATPAPTIIATPAPEDLMYPDAHGDYLYDVENNTYQPARVNATPTPIPANLDEARRLGWTPDLGVDAEAYVERYNLAYGYTKPAPQLSLELLDVDREPWDWQHEVIQPDDYIEGYIRVNNLADWAYQGTVDIYVNASLFYDGGTVHMENRIISLDVSIPPKNYNEFYKKWSVKEIAGPVSTGVYEIIIELRDRENGKTIYSTRMTPAVAHVDPYSGIKYF